MKICQDLKNKVKYYHIPIRCTVAAYDTKYLFIHIIRTCLHNIDPRSKYFRTAGALSCHILSFRSIA